MLRDVLQIPHAWLGTPVFGFGWLLLAWGLFSVGLLIWLLRRHGWGPETRGYLPVMVVVAAVIWWLLPRLEVAGPDGTPMGLPIRGYGMMLLLAIVSAVALAAIEARRMGLDSELIVSLAFYVIISGLVGARLLYVIQYWEPQFQRDTPGATLAAVLNVTQGGLIVYGSFFGAVLAAIWFLYRHRLPILAIADLVTPSLMLGLALGRIGCLLNGCCFGGPCTQPGLGVRFPAESPPYERQRSEGLLYGFRIETQPDTGAPVVARVLRDTPAMHAGLREGDLVRAIDGMGTPTRESAMGALSVSGKQLEIESDRGIIRIALREFPTHSQPIHATQIYSAINAGLICLLAWSWYPYRRRDGEVFALMLTLYPISRFLMELVREDEAGVFGTDLSPAQFVSLGLLLAVAAFWAFLARRPRGSVLPVDAGRAVGEA